MNFCCRIYYRCLPFIPSQTSMCWNIWQRESRSSLQLVISFDEIKLQKYNATIQCRNYLIRCWWDMAFFLLFLYSLLWNFPNGTNLSPPTVQCLCFLRPTQKKISARTCSTPPFFFTVLSCCQNWQGVWQKFIYLQVKAPYHWKMRSCVLWSILLSKLPSRRQIWHMRI